MILNEHFFTILHRQYFEHKAEFRIKLNAEHFVYRAHFPNNPITPGVCLLQMTIELFELLKGEKFRMNVLKNVKFIAPVSPLECPEIDVLLEFTQMENFWNVKAIIQEKEIIFAKISLSLSEKHENLRHHSGL